jgi:hypothetical protein
VDRSLVRSATVTAANSTYTASEWTRVDAQPISSTAPSAVDSAAADSTNRLGYHVYNH